MTATSCGKIGVCKVGRRDFTIRLWGFENNCSLMQLGESKL
jgi:hypothetical protein